MPGKATPPPACGRPLLVRGGENDCGVGCSSPPFSRRGKPLRHRDALLLLFQGGENHCEIGMLFPSFFKEGCRRSRRGGWCGFTPTPPPACGRPLLMRGGENDCEL